MISHTPIVRIGNNASGALLTSHALGFGRATDEMGDSSWKVVAPRMARRVAGVEPGGAAIMHRQASSHIKPIPLPAGNGTDQEERGFFAVGLTRIRSLAPSPVVAPRSRLAALQIAPGRPAAVERCPPDR